MYEFVCGRDDEYPEEDEEYVSRMEELAEIENFLPELLEDCETEEEKQYVIWEYLSDI